MYDAFHIVKRTEVEAVGSYISGKTKFIDVFVHIDAYFSCSVFFR